MSGHITYQAADLLLNHLLLGIEHKAPRSLYLGLSLWPANREGIVCEPEDASYSRVRLGEDQCFFMSAERGETRNFRPFVFPTPVGDWGIVRSVFLANAEWDSEVIASADLTVPKRVLRGDAPPTIPPGGFIFRMC